MGQEDQVAQEGPVVAVESLSRMTGFPMDFIRGELFLGEHQDQLSMPELRRKILRYLEETMRE